MGIMKVFPTLRTKLKHLEVTHRYPQASGRKRIRWQLARSLSVLLIAERKLTHPGPPRKKMIRRQNIPHPSKMVILIFLMSRLSHPGRNKALKQENVLPPLKQQRKMDLSVPVVAAVYIQPKQLSKMTRNRRIAIIIPLLAKPGNL
ncbi:hypothetical protein CSUI_002108 [Cystoisospora suis]|uniref:Uncharacterized protein n=1 Tax=Cystoisospora suis TaxID=483139 RepID=A0A2C6LA60_9APIC|nr:hypothetical protein CSUI_002108 [Cystoisospora suis]